MKRHDCISHCGQVPFRGFRGRREAGLYCYKNITGTIAHVDERTIIFVSVRAVPVVAIDLQLAKQPVRKIIRMK